MVTAYMSIEYPNGFMERSVGVEDRLQEYWDWIAVALFLFLTVDTLTTIYAAEMFGLNAEANPVIRWALRQGIGTLILVNIVAVLLVVVIFYGLLELIKTAPEPYDWVISRALEVWIGLVLSAGLLVFANNISVILLGRGLL